jgi:hypothetical protein
MLTAEAQSGVGANDDLPSFIPPNRDSQQHSDQFVGRRTAMIFRVVMHITDSNKHEVYLCVFRDAELRRIYTHGRRDVKTISVIDSCCLVFVCFN